MRPLVYLLLASTALGACGTTARQASASATADSAAASRHGSVQLPSGLQLHYVEQGRQEGQVVVLLHGYTDSYRSFDLVLPLLPRDVRVFALDQRGHGDSSRPDCCYAQSDFASDVVAFLDSQRIPRAVLVGHSMGSFIAQQVALEHPDRVQALVLIGSAPTVRGNPVAAELKNAVDSLSDPIDPAFVRDFQASTFLRPIPPSFWGGFPRPPSSSAGTRMGSSPSPTSEPSSTRCPTPPSSSTRRPGMRPTSSCPNASSRT